MPKMPSRGKDLLFGAQGISESKGDRRYFDLINATVDDRVIAQGRRSSDDIGTYSQGTPLPHLKTKHVGLGSPSCCITVALDSNTKTYDRRLLNIL